MACSHLAVFAAYAASKEAEADPVEHCHEAREMVCRVMVYHISGLVVERAKHVVCVGFPLILWGAPLKCLCNRIAKRWEDFWEVGQTMGMVNPNSVWNHSAADFR